MTNNHRSSGRGDDSRHSSENASPQPLPPAPPTTKQALLLQRRQPPPGASQREPWLFQSLNFTHHSHSLPALPPASSTTTTSSPSLNSLQPVSPLSAFTLDTDAPFFLDVASLKRLLPSSLSSPSGVLSSPHFRPKSSNSGGVYGSLHHQNNNTRPQHSSRRKNHRQLIAHTSVRLEALAGPAPTRRTSHKRKTSRAALVTGSSRKYALRLDGAKGRAVANDSVGDNRDTVAKATRQAKAVRRSSYDDALTYKSDDDANHDDKDAAVARAIEDQDEATRQKTVIAAQLNLTLEEYGALDAAFGGDHRRSRDSDADSDSGDESTTTDQYDTLFAQFDVDSSGAISPTELRALLRAAGEDMDDAELAAVLEQADTNGDGEIDVDEFVGLMRARKRLLRVANQMGTAGAGLTNDSNALSLSLSLLRPPVSPSSLALSLPPLKMASLQSKQHLEQFTPHFTRPTPACLRPGARVDLTQLRRELAVAEFGVQKLNAKSQALARALSKWRAFQLYERNKERADAFLKCKASQKVSELMAKWHRRVIRRRFVKWRIECVVDARTELHCAAVELQRVLRGKFARLQVQRLRACIAATAIQAAVRGRLARLEVSRLRKARREHACASLLQRCYRGYTGKRLARALFTAQREARAAMRIQRAFRHHHRRALLRVIQQTKREHDCAIRIQCCVRASLARRERARRARDRTQRQCATTIQRYVRGRLARRLAAEMRRREAAAVKVQRAFRGFRSRVRVQLLRHERAFLAQHARAAAAATTLQAHWRGVQGRKRYSAERLRLAEAERLALLQRLASARAIQSAFRAYQRRREAQRARFEKLKWRHVALLNRSALVIQAFWRGYHGRLASHLRLQAKRALELEAHEAANRIQLVVRARLARIEKQKLLRERESLRLHQQAQAEAARAIQKVTRGRQARLAAAALHHEHQAEAQRALERLVVQTKRTAAVRIQCCARRFLARRRYEAAREAAQRRLRVEEARLVQQQAALVIQCAMRRARAQRLLRQRRHEFERRISMMASEKAHDEIARLRKQQEAELLALKLQLQLQQRQADQEAATLRDDLVRQRADEADALARLQLEALLQAQQKSARRVRELERAKAAERLRATLDEEQHAAAHAEALTRTQENDELARLKLTALFEASSGPLHHHDQSQEAVETEAAQLRTAALALHVEQAKLKIQAACLTYITHRRLARLVQAQAQQLASLHDEAERVQLRAVQAKEVALARLKAMIDDDARMREQELRALEAQMLERARVEKERVMRRDLAAQTLQALGRGFLGRQRVRAIQARVEKERIARANALEAALAEAEARVAQVLAGDTDNDNENDNDDRTDDVGADDGSEWVEYWDENAQASYFYNTRTQEASWTRPVSAPSASVDSAGVVSVDHEPDSYADDYGVETSGSVATGAEGYADEYGYYDHFGQYHYYETDATYAGQSVAGAGPAFPEVYPGLAPAAYAYQAAMASMLFGLGNPMTQQFAANPMLQQYATSMLAATGQVPAVMATPAPATMSTDALDVGAAPPDPWEKFFDQYTGAAYYYNSLTGEKYWA